jgi:glycosyltransferase involved in cell wall biosynthesis
MAHERLRRAIREALDRWDVDVVHMHGIDFAAYLPPPGVPVLATLHLPVDWYPAGALYPSRPHTWLNCVSRAQHANCRANPKLLPPIENGIDLGAFTRSFRKRDFALMLTRICPEKGIHIAIEAAKRADVPLLIAGEVFPYPEHRRYFVEVIAPRLDRGCRFIGPVNSSRKSRLLASARCVLVPSLVPETSSLAACEALASGTPVVAFAKGALPDIVEHNRTGFLVRTVEEMASALVEVNRLDPETCRAAARQRFSDRRMAARYFSVYRELAEQATQQSVAGAA